MRETKKKVLVGIPESLLSQLNHIANTECRIRGDVIVEGLRAYVDQYGSPRKPTFVPTAPEKAKPPAVDLMPRQDRVSRRLEIITAAYYEEHKEFPTVYKLAKMSNCSNDTASKFLRSKGRIPGPVTRAKRS